jgi:hypothetical protein
LTSINIPVIDNRDVLVSHFNAEEGPVPRPYPDALALTRRVLRIVIVLNLLLGFLILALLIATLVAQTFVVAALGVPPRNQSAALILGMRLVMVLGIASVPLAHLVLKRLQAIVDTVGQSDPFVAENAVRMRTIAWAVLGMELMHLAIGVIAAAVSTREQPFDVDWSFSFTPWVAVLLLFVLARVFEQGALMRDDLQGTV